MNSIKFHGTKLLKKINCVLYINNEQSEKNVMKTNSIYNSVEQNIISGNKFNQGRESIKYWK